MSKKDKLQEKLDNSRERFLEAIEFLTDEALIKKEAVGRFSVANLIILLTAWEAELVTALMRLNQGKKPGKLLDALSQPDEYESRCLLENKGRDLDVLFDDFQRVRFQLETWLEHFSESDLTEPKRYKWLKDKTLEQLISELSYKNEQKYLSALHAFSQKYIDDDHTNDEQLNSSLINGYH